MPKIKNKKIKIKEKLKAKKPASSILSNNSLGGFIKTLRISSEQEKFLLNELPQMDKKERVDLLGTLADVYALNQEEDEAINKLKANWE